MNFYTICRNNKETFEKTIFILTGVGLVFTFFLAALILEGNLIYLFLGAALVTTIGFGWFAQSVAEKTTTLRASFVILIMGLGLLYYTDPKLLLDLLYLLKVF